MHWRGAKHVRSIGYRSRFNAVVVALVVVVVAAGEVTAVEHASYGKQWMVKSAAVRGGVKVFLPKMKNSCCCCCA